MVGEAYLDSNNTLPLTCPKVNGNMSFFQYMSLFRYPFKQSSKLIVEDDGSSSSLTDMMINSLGLFSMNFSIVFAMLSNLAF